MADNVAITAGSGTTIAADDIGAGVLAQRVKLVLGADGTGIDAVAGAGAVSTGVQRMTLASDDPLVAKVPAALGAGGGMKVQLYTTGGSAVDPVAAGTAAMAASIPVTLATNDTQMAALLAAVRARVVAIVPTCDATATAQYDVLAATEVLAGACAAADIPTGLRGVTIRRLDSATGVAIRVWLLSANTSVAAENAPFAPADSDMDDIIGYVDFAAADYVNTTGMATNCFAQKTSDLWCKPATGTTNLYIALQSMEAIDLGAATDISLEFHFI